MFCPECGKTVEEGVVFCPNCGAKVGDTLQAVSPVSQLIKKREGGGVMKDFFSFRKMVSTAIIKFIYILGAIVLTIGGVGILFSGGRESLIGIVVIILGNLLWRIFCELWVLAFSVHDILGSIEKSLKEK